MRDGYLLGSEFCSWRVLAVKCAKEFSPVFAYSDARGWPWPSAPQCRHAVPSSSFLCWPTSPWPRLWMLACCQWVRNQSRAYSRRRTKICLFSFHNSHTVLQQMRTRTRMTSSALRCIRTWTWRASKCGWSGARRVISTDPHAAPTAACVITVWRLVHAKSPARRDAAQHQLLHAHWAI